MNAHSQMLRFALPLAIFAGSALAQDKTDFALNGGQVKFHAPTGWTAIMEKSDGSPQTVVFQVPDAAANGTEDMASVTIKTRELKSAQDFAPAVQDEFERSKAQTGYEADPSANDPSSHIYFVQRAKTRYVVRDTFLLKGAIAVQVRCQRPILQATPADWASSFDASCKQVAASLKQ